MGRRARKFFCLLLREESSDTTRGADMGSVPVTYIQPASDEVRGVAGDRAISRARARFIWRVSTEKGNGISLDSISGPEGISYRRWGEMGR